MSILFAFILFSFLVLIHEVGHFVAAKLSGVRVTELSIFVGPALLQKLVGETVYSLRLIPFGGYCAMEEENQGDERSFSQAAVWKRLCILVAGAAMNFLTGILLMVIVCLPVVSTAVPIIESFEPFCTINGDNGLQEGDLITQIDGERIYVYSDISMVLSLNPGDVHDLTVRRNGQTIRFDDFNMRRHEIVQPDGTVRRLFGMNFSAEQLSAAGKIRLAWAQCMDSARMVRLSLQMLVRGQAGIQDLTGPVGIVQQMSSVAEASPTRMDALLNMLYFGAFLAINLGVMNLLPIPALDGGRVVGLLITAAAEAVLGKKIDPKYEGYLHGAGMALLLALMVVIMFKDIWVLLR